MSVNYIWFEQKPADSTQEKRGKRGKRDDEGGVERPIRAHIDYLGKDVLDGFLLTASQDAEVRTYVISSYVTSSNVIL